MTEGSPVRSPTPDDRVIRRTWRILSASFLLLGILAIVRLALPGATLLDGIAAVLLAVGFAAALANRHAVVAREAGRRVEAESFARMLHGLSRSVSPDAVVEAIVAELALVTEADHVAVVQRRPDRAALDATLVTTRPGVPATSAVLPIVDLEDRVDVPSDAVAIAIGDVAANDRAAATARALRARRVPVPSGGWLAATTRLASRGVGSPVRDRAEPIEVVGRGAAARIAARIAARVRTSFGLSFVLVAPLRSDGRVVGAIIVSRRSGAAWPDATRRLLAAAATEAAAALERAIAQRDAETRATTDALTGLPNRRYFDEFCALIGRRRRAGDAIGVLMIDIDRFKRLNDTFGHAAGDEVLRAVAGAIAAAVRDDDVPCRFGGEEFAVILRNPGPGVAADVGERVRAAVAALDLRALGVPAVSVSVGVAVSHAPGEPIADVVAQADAALYAAKRSGRDRVVAAA